MRLRRPLPAVQGDALHIVGVGDNRIGKYHPTMSPDVWNAIGTWVLALIAIPTLGYAAHQIHLTRQQNRADILMTLENRWNSPKLVVARKKIRAFINEIDNKAKAEKTGQRAAEVMEYSEDLFAQKIDEESQIQNSDKYDAILEILDFTETAGYIARKNYIPKEDVIMLFGGALLSFRRAMRQHILKVQEIPGTTGRAWTYSLWLFYEVHKVAERIKKEKLRA